MLLIALVNTTKLKRMGMKFSGNDVLKRLEEHRDKQNLPHTFKVLHYNTVRDSAIEVTRSNHNTTEIRSLDQYRQTTYGSICCATGAIRRLSSLDKRRKEHEEKVTNLANKRGT